MSDSTSPFQNNNPVNKPSIQNPDRYVFNLYFEKTLIKTLCFENPISYHRLARDAQWRGSIVVARPLRDAGMEVIYLGNQMPEAIAETAVQEDADHVGLNTLSGNHLGLAPEVVRHLRKKGMEKKTVILGGAIPPGDIPKLKEASIGEVFGSGTPLKRIVDFIWEMS